MRNAILDLRYGAPLGGMIPSRYRHLGAKDVANSDYNHLSALFAGVDVSPDDVIVDVGCGKGRAINWFLSRYPNNTIYGIELDPEVCAATDKRLRNHSNVRIICGDATKLLPDEGTLFYLYNPFYEHVMRGFIAAVTNMPPSSRTRRIAYNRCEYVELFLDDPRFDVTMMIEVPISHGAALIRVN